MTGAETGSPQDHLFISYATQQGQLADWLTVKLTAAGYLVWSDRVKLLGGESYPKDIDRAIKERAFRVIALLSKEALQRPNPTGERTLALKLGVERCVDFLIPLNVTGLSGTDLDWMTTNLTYIPFNHGWAGGFAQLIDKLESIDAPRPLNDGRTRVASWYNSRSEVAEGTETLWANFLAINGVPAEVLRLQVETAAPLDWPEGWVSHWPADQSVGWCLELPDGGLPNGVLVTPVPWGLDTPERNHVLDVVTTLLRKHLERYVTGRGMRFEDPVAYFPVDLIENEKLRYTSTGGKRYPVNATGQRNFRTLGGGREKVNYHLGFAAHPDFRTFGTWVLHVHPRIVLRDMTDKALDPKVAHRRRKAMCRMWFNHQWGTRFKAIVEWLAPEGAPAMLSQHGATALQLVGTPVQVTGLFSIDESSIEDVLEDDRVDLDERDGTDPDELEAVDV